MKIIYEQSESGSSGDEFNDEIKTTKYLFHNMILCHTIAKNDEIIFERHKNKILEMQDDVLKSKEFLEDNDLEDLRERPIKKEVKEMMIEALKCSILLRKNEVS